MKRENPDLPKIGAPAQRALQSVGVTKLKQLTRLTEAELGQLHGMGPNALGRLREALQAKGLSFKAGVVGHGPKKKKASPVSRTDRVDEFMEALRHPLKAEAEAVRTIIKSVNKNIVEEIKWQAPSFSYKGGYLVTFNLRDTNRIHLVFHNPMISEVSSRLLEGDDPDRRRAYFHGLQEIKSKRPALEKALRDLIRLQEKP